LFYWLVFLMLFLLLAMELLCLGNLFLRFGSWSSRFVHFGSSNGVNVLWVAAQEYSVKYSGGGWLIIKGYFGNRTVCVNVFIICGLFGIYGLFCSSVLCLYLLCVVYKSLLVFLLIELFCELFSWCDQLLLCINFHR